MQDFPQIIERFTAMLVARRIRMGKNKVTIFRTTFLISYPGTFTLTGRRFLPVSRSFFYVMQKYIFGVFMKYSVPRTFAPIYSFPG
jgi:hypothetical protein